MIKVYAICLLASIALIACGPDISNTTSTSAGGVAVCNDGEYCTGVSDEWRDGACFDGECIRCGAFECGGMLGCSDKEIFSGNGQLTCPKGCYSSCAP